jgi:hypothetical protein
MESQRKSELHSEREAQFIHGIDAFRRRDFDALERAMQSGVIIHVPGSSWLAGDYRGYEEAGRCILGLRHVLDSSEKRISFLHEGHHMIVRHDIMVHGPQHEAEMTLLVRVRYGPDGKAQSISVEPEDLGLFDHVLNIALKDSAVS